jgi:hypothetical protein
MLVARLRRAEDEDKRAVISGINEEMKRYMRHEIAYTRTNMFCSVEVKVPGDGKAKAGIKEYAGMPNYSLWRKGSAVPAMWYDKYSL